MSILKIHEKLKSLVQTERKITSEILRIIQTLDISKDYRKLGYSSLFEYLTSALGYSEGAAQRRISASRLLKQCPKIEADVESGHLNLTQISLAQSAFQQQEKQTKVRLSSERKSEILDKLKGQNSFETKRILLTECPEFEVPKPRPGPLKNNKVSVSLEFKDCDWKKVKNLMAKMSHKIPDQKLESLLIYWADELTRKEAKSLARDLKQTQSQAKDIKQASSQSALPSKLFSPPLRKWSLESAPKIKQHLDSKPPLQQSFYPQLQLEPEFCSKPEQKACSPRAPIPLAVQRAIRKKAQYQCQYVSKITGKRCRSQHFLEIEHIHPKALGGGDHVNNLKLLCRSHNQEMARAWGISQ